MIYLNNASTTFPKPESVLQAINQNLTTPPFNYGRTGISRGDKNIVNDTRKSLKNFFKAGDDFYMVFTSGSTEAINFAIKGIELEGKNVVISASEHNSVIRPLKTLEQKGIITLTVVPVDNTGFINPEDVESAINNNTALVCINHCSNVTGTVQNIEKIAEIVHKNGSMLLVDGSQSSGVIDIDIDKLNPDFFCFTGHKSLYGIQGSGGLIFKKKINLKTFKEGGTGTLSHILYQPDEFPYKYESGTLNLPGIVGLEAGIKWISEIGLDTIKSRKVQLIKLLISELSEIRDIIFYYNPEITSGSILSFNISDIPPEEINYILANSFDISIRSGIHCAPLLQEYLKTSNYGTLRVSPSYFTKEEEIIKFSTSLKSIIKSIRTLN